MLSPPGYTPYATAQHKLTMAENFGLAGIAAVVSKVRPLFPQQPLCARCPTRVASTRGLCELYELLKPQD